MVKLQERAADYRWDDLRILLALVREGTLGGAASRLGVDATTIGRRLTALEHALGAKLLTERATASSPRKLPCD